MMSLFSVILVVIDQFTKYLTSRYLKPVENIDLIPKVLSLTYVENRGAAFGIMQNARWFFIIATAIVLIVFALYILKAKPKSRLFKISAALIFAGAAGNLIDRVAFGFVVDMMRVHFFDFPVFNFADCCVVIGTALLAVYILFYDSNSPKGMK